MIFHHRTSWVIGVIAMFVLFACVSSSASVRLRKPRKRTTTRSPMTQQQLKVGSLIIKVLHKYSDDEHSVSSNYASNNRGDARDKLNLPNYEKLDASKTHFGQHNLLSDERYIVYPKKYELFVSKKNTGRTNRYRRNVPSNSHLPNASHYTESDNEDTSKVTKKQNKSKPKKIVLQKPHEYIKLKNTLKSARKPETFIDEQRNVSKTAIDSPGGDSCVFDHRRYEEPSRTRRSSINEYLPRRNASDYYAQRKAVMERFYARQREINARYANRTNNVPQLKHNDILQNPVRSNASLFRPGQEYSNKDTSARDNATFFRQLSITIDPIYSNESEKNGIQPRMNNGQDIIRESNLDSKSDRDLSQIRNSSNIERDGLDYYVTATPCTNIPSSGTFAPKTRWKQLKNCTHGEVQTNDNFHHIPIAKLGNNSDVGNDRQSWGQCEGRIVYQHNLLLGLKGPSNLDAVFQVIIQGSVCITCVEALRYNETRATVSLDSGGRGYEYVKLKLKGFENEGFSYIIKIWGVKKIGRICNGIN